MFPSVGDRGLPGPPATEPFARRDDRRRGRAPGMPPTKVSTPSKSATPKAPAKSKATKAADQRSHQARRASILLKHVSDPTRLQVILILSDGEQHVGAL